MGTSSFYTGMIKDSHAVYFTKENYNIANDGSADVSEQLQEAINSIVTKYGYGILFVPQGTYLLGKTIYIPKAVRMIGYGEKRPEFVLKDYATDFDKPLFGDKGGYRYLFWFVDKIVDNQILDANPGTFYSAMSNVNIRLGYGNSYAVALRTHYAQHGFLSHMDIDVMSGMAGIYDVGNEIEDIKIRGGNYGIVTTKCSPGWPFLMIDTYFCNQKVAAIKTHEAGLTIIRNRTANVPCFIDVDENYFEKIYIENSVYENISQCLLNVAMDENSLTQIHLKNVACEDVNKIAIYKDSERVVGIEKDGIINYIHGTVISDVCSDRKIIDEIHLISEDVSIEEILKSDIKELPDVKEWVNVTEIGIVGDGVTDNSEMIKNAIAHYRNLYFPQGEYLFSDRIKLKKDTNIIAMHPYATRLILKDNSEAFTGIGPVKGFVETMVDGTNIINGIGVETGGKNPRAAAILWRAGEESYVNDVKLIGGHGNLVKGTGEFENPYNKSRTADANIERMWDNQYASFLVENGGGVFKDIWSASPYASSGFEVRNTQIPSKVYCMSLEHHQRNELRLNHVRGWRFYALQTEEEFAEGEYALPIELIACENIYFSMTYFFRTIFVKTAMDYCIKCFQCKNIQFHNVHNNSQMKYTITAFLKNFDNNCEIRLWQASKAYVKGNSKGLEMTEVPKRCVHSENLFDERNISIERKQVNQFDRIYEGFRFADGGITDEEGNFYFVDSLSKRVYKIDGDNLSLTVVFESPVKINSIALDTFNNLIYIGEYVIPKGATKNGVLQQNILPPDSYGTSYGFWYNKDAVTFAFTQESGRIRPLEKIPMGDIKPELVYYPGNRWRDGTDFPQVVQYHPGYAYLAPDERTMIPCHYDLIRANTLAKGIPGEKIYAVDELYKRVYMCDVLENGLLENPEPIIEQGDFCVTKGRDRIYVCDDNIKIYSFNGELIEILKIPERPTTIGLDEKGKGVKYITTRNKVYLLKR